MLSIVDIITLSYTNNVIISVPMYWSLFDLGLLYTFVKISKILYTIQLPDGEVGKNRIK